MDVLVAYATAHGSTAGVARHIGQRLSAAGYQVAIRPTTEIADISPYSAAVVGSAIHNGHWLKSGADLIEQNQVFLRERPVWLFSVSSLGDHSGAFADPMNRWLRKMRKEPTQIAGFRAAINPRDHRNFTGAIEPSHWSWWGRLVFRIFGGRFGDHRDWPDIDRWSDRIIEELGRAGLGP